MKKLINILLIALLLNSCATSNETRWVQRMQKEGDAIYAIGPVVEIKLTKRQLRNIRNSEYNINIKDKSKGNNYPSKVTYLDLGDYKFNGTIGPYRPTKK